MAFHVARSLKIIPMSSILLLYSVFQRFQANLVILHFLRFFNISKRIRIEFVFDIILPFLDLFDGVITPDSELPHPNPNVWVLLTLSVLVFHATSKTNWNHFGVRNPLEL